MNVDQTQFTGAILDPASAVPAGLTDPAGRPAGRRFAVYRNNVAVSLTEALETGFPTIRKLVGEEFFKAMAGVYLRAHPPRSPLMMHFGQDMPEFLAGFPPAQSLPYLADIARMELSMRRAYHAADPLPFDPARLQEMAADALMAAQFELAPAVQLIRSDYPIHAIYEHAHGRGPKPAPCGQAVAVLRVEFDPSIHLITADQFAFLTALKAGQSLGDALEAVSEEFDLGGALGLLLANRSISNIIEG